MKKLLPALFLVFISILSFHCQKEISYAFPGNGSNNNPNPVKATLQGRILDETGQVLAGVKVKVGNQSGITDNKGYFRILNAGLDKTESLVTAEANGYFKAYRSFMAGRGANHVEIKLIKHELTGTIPATGGEVTLSNGSKISLPASSVTKAGGGNYTGDIKVYAAYIDPTADDIAQRIPGSFMADDKNDKRVILESFGMLAVELESTSGEKLQIAGGKTATLSAPIPSSLQASAPATIPLWYVDEQTGIWKEEGMATRSGNTYTGDVQHFSFWNYDISVNAVTLTVTLKGIEAGPLVNAPVRIKRTNNAGSSYGWTDSLGEVSGLVPSNENLVLEVLDGCNNVVYTQNLSPLTQNTNLGTITLPGTVVSLVTVKGKLLNCSNHAVADGTAGIVFDNIPRFVRTNANGEFSITLVRCPGSNSSIEITGIDNVSLQQNTVTGITLVSPITNAGNITACGTSASQFINYTVGSTNYTLNLADSITAFTRPTNVTPVIYVTSIFGFRIGQQGGDEVNLRFDTPSETPGVYAAVTASVNGMDIVVPPFNITVTSFPVLPGGFYEGSFSGKVKETAASPVTHTVSGTFRVRKW